MRMTMITATPLTHNRRTKSGAVERILATTVITKMEYGIFNDKGDLNALCECVRVDVPLKGRKKRKSHIECIYFLTNDHFGFQVVLKRLWICGLISSNNRLKPGHCVHVCI